MKLKKISDIIKSIGAPNKDDTLLGVFNGKTAQKSIADILTVADYTALQNQPIPILSKDFKVSDLKESSLYFVNNNGISCKKEDGSLLVNNLYAGILILTGTGGEAQVFDSYNTYYVQDLSTGDWFNDDCNHITTQEVKDMLDDYLRNLPCARTGGLVYSTKEEIGRPELKAVTLGNGLKFENGVLSLDIENGDNLKYGTSTTAEANEVTANE